MEVYSIDELKPRLKKNTCRQVYMGIADTKILAKISNRIAKKSSKVDGVQDLNTRTKILKLPRWKICGG